MIIGLFASGTVGSEIAEFLGSQPDPIALLVLDANGSASLNRHMIEASRIPPERLIYSDRLYEKETLEALHQYKLDLLILAWWPYILKDCLIRIPRLGCLNFHPSYLPYDRGKHPNFWTIVDDSPFGVTLHFIGPGVDSGDVAYQSRIAKTWEDSGKTLYFKAQREIVRLFKEKFPEIREGRIPRFPQTRTQGSYHHSSELENGSRIDLDRNYRARDLLNLLRARTFPPHPGACFMDQGEKYEVRIHIRKI